jgi:hypothetical protein
LYSQSRDGEIIIEWNEAESKLYLITMIDFSPGKLEKQQALPKFLEMIEKTSHPNLLNLCGKSQILK